MYIIICLIQWIS